MNAAALDKRSFILGMITAFSECVAGGCKRLALSPPLTGEDWRLYAQEACEIIRNHGLNWFHEENLDRPAPDRREWILIFAGQETLAQYQALRAKGYSPMDSLAPFSALLSYDPENSVHTGYDAYRTFFP